MSLTDLFPKKPLKWKPKKQKPVVAQTVGKPGDGSTQMNLMGRVHRTDREIQENNRQAIFEKNQRLARQQHGLEP